MKDLWIWLLAAAVAGFLVAYWLVQPPKSPKIPPTAAFLEEPIKGAEDAPVTIVEFADFKCGYCLRHFAQTLPLIEEEYINTGKVRYIYRNFPILGVQSRLAALAAECAHEQGHFWEYHDALFKAAATGQGDFVRSRLKEIARQVVGLSSTRFDECVDSYKYLGEVQQDLDAGRTVGVTGTPGFLINDELLPGAYPIETFRQKIEEALGKTQKSQATPIPSPIAAPATVLLEEPAKGAEDAPVTIIEFADFRCGYCLRHFRQTLPLIEEEYIKTGKVRYIYRNFPILGVQSRLAALGAECAHEQGRFWEYHDKLFELVQENQGSFTQSQLKSVAGELGLVSAQFDECLDSSKYLDEVQEDLTAGHTANVTGTPAFLINGELLVGAQPMGVFRQKIEEALAKRQKP